MEERGVATRLGTLHVRRLGKGSPVVLWHSLYVDGRSMLPVAEALAADHDVIVPDGPGHGKSPAAGRTYTVDDCADAAVDLLDALGLPVVDWVGNAWGGHTGVALARKAPARLKSLVAICSPLQPVTRADKLKGRVLLETYRWFGPVAQVLDPLTDILVLRENALAVKHVHDVFTAQDRVGMAEAITSVMVGRTSLEGPIPVRTLLVSTEKNTVVTPDQLHAQAKAAGATAKILSGSKHLPPLEEPQVVVDLLRAWWGQASTST